MKIREGEKPKEISDQITVKYLKGDLVIRIIGKNRPKTDIEQQVSMLLGRPIKLLGPKS